MLEGSSFTPSKSEVFHSLFFGETGNPDFPRPDPPKILLAKLVCVEKGGSIPPHDDRNNVHWLKAMSDDCWLFTIKMYRLDETVEYCARINLDVERATASGGALITPVITPQEATERY